jgi:hypothetical protein
MIHDDDDKPTQADKLRCAAEIRRGYLLWLARHLAPEKYKTLLPVARADIRKAVADELRLLAEGM